MEVGNDKGCRDRSGEYLIVAFPGSRFRGEIAPALTDLVQAGTIRIIDMAFASKDENGDVAVFELSDLDPAALLVWENVWARPIAEAIRDAGGELYDYDRIPHEIVVAAREWALANA
jgi:hypothetical protein